MLSVRPPESETQPVGAAKSLATNEGAELVRRCRTGDGAAWEEIVQTYTRRIYNLAYRFTSRAGTAEDLTQEVFIRVYRSLEQYNPKQGDLQNWLMRLARNLVIDDYRKRQRAPQDEAADYLDGALEVQANRQFAEHAMRCPVCHDLLSEVKNTLLACSASEAPIAGTDLEARILLKTMPETAIKCSDFEAYLTDYLDGFLMAPLYHRWERHAALCAGCSELPGAVVRTIGACYTYKQNELTVPAGLEARILQSTIGNVLPREVRAPLKSRLVEWLRGTLDPIVSPQLASVATMLLVSVFVLTNTVSTDGSVGGIYHASLQLAERTAGNASRSSALPNGMKQLAGSVNELMGGDEESPKGNDANTNQNSSNQNGAPQGTKNNATQSKSKSGSNEQKNR